jgi:enoyl-CoA hydratase/carnithine racemase
MIDLTYDDTVAVLSLNRGVTNALNLACVRELAETLHRVAVDPQARAIVLTSANNKFFSIGFDIPQLFDLSQEDFATFYRAFNKTCMALYTHPKPTVAAITGHAIAGGCILTLCCDYRFIGEGRKLMGLNEIKLSVPVPYVADRVLHSLVGARAAREILELGEFYQAEESLELGLVDQVWPLEEVLPRSVERAGLLGAFEPQAYGAIKQNRVEPVEAQVRARWEERQRTFVECWYSDDARKRLREARAKF